MKPIRDLLIVVLFWYLSVSFFESDFNLLSWDYSIKVGFIMSIIITYGILEGIMVIIHIEKKK